MVEPVEYGVDWLFIGYIIGFPLDDPADNGAILSQETGLYIMYCSANETVCLTSPG